MSPNVTRYRWWRDPSRLVRRFYWRMFLPMAFVAVVLITAGLSKVPQIFWPIGNATFVVVMIVWAVLFCLWFFVVISWERRLVQKLLEANYKLCPHCGYELAGHEGRINCPECGKVCDINKIQATWRSFRPRVTGGRP